MKSDVLPESRARVVRGVVRGPCGNMIPIYCANCGNKWGLVPEHYVTFAFALCDSCAEKHGDIAHTYKEPDAEFWERVRQVEMEERQPITPELVAKRLDERNSTLSTLKREWDAKIRRY